MCIGWASVSDAHCLMQVTKFEALSKSQLFKVHCKRVICVGFLGPSDANHLYQRTTFHPIKTLFSSPNINWKCSRLFLSPQTNSPSPSHSPALPHPRWRPSLLRRILNPLTRFSSFSYCTHTHSFSLILDPHSHSFLVFSHTHSRLPPTLLVNPCGRLAVSVDSLHTHFPTLILHTHSSTRCRFLSHSLPLRPTHRCRCRPTRRRRPFM